jgi:EAL domain-containing protein (putative c-di-GMP-specific phosphodiesterase class I)
MTHVIEADTRVWREERGITQTPQAILFYTPNATISGKLRGVLHLHQLGYLEPAPNTILVAADSQLLDLAVTQWRGSLSDADCNDIRGALFESCVPSAKELARAPMHLEELDQLLARMHTRWFVKLLAAHSVSVVLQPLISVATASCVACECLVRGDQEGVPVGAERLLSAARVLGVLHELDFAAWRAAVEKGHALVKNGLALFLNFTPSSVYKSMFDVKKTKAMCREMGVDMSQLVFEVTEAEKVSDFGSLKRVMDEYRAEGAKIALDDLGSGYSSILRLSDLRPDYVKLDQRLVHGAFGDRLRSVLLKAVTEASHELDICVVAEGVETEEDLRFCLEIGADLVQGYLLACPGDGIVPVSTEALQILQQSCPEKSPVMATASLPG